MEQKIEIYQAALKALGHEILKGADKQDQLMKESALGENSIDTEMENYHRGQRDALLWIVQRLEGILKVKVDDDTK